MIKFKLDYPYKMPFSEDWIEDITNIEVRPSGDFLIQIATCTNKDQGLMKNGFPPPYIRMHRNDALALAYRIIDTYEDETTILDQMNDLSCLRMYRIERTHGAGYDEFDGFIIAANNEQKVRQIAASHAADEGPETWTNETLSMVTTLGLTTEHIEQVLLCSFNAG